MKTFQAIIIFLLVCVIAYLLIFYKGKPLPYPITKYVYDTTFIDKPYPVPKPYPYEVLVQGVTIYEPDTIALDSMKILLNKKEVMIWRLDKQIHISQNYLKQFPSNPKLLELNLSLDTLSLSLLKTDGIPSKSEYGLNLSGFKYKWTNDGLSVTRVNSPSVKKKYIALNYFAEGGVNFLYFSPYIGFNIETDISRIRLYAGIEAGLLNKNASSINLGLKYRINK